MRPGLILARFACSFSDHSASNAAGERFISPSPETLALYKQIKSQAADHPSAQALFTHLPILQVAEPGLRKRESGLGLQSTTGRADLEALDNGGKMA